MEEKFVKKLRQLFSYLNKNVTCLVDDVAIFKDPANKRFKTLLKAPFSLAGAAMQ